MNGYGKWIFSDGSYREGRFLNNKENGIYIHTKLNGMKII
jgi:hypothetical protein